MKAFRFFVVLLLLVSCRNGKVDKISDDSQSGAEKDTVPVHQTFRCKGHFTLHPAKLVTVTAPINGFIKKMYYYTGDYVKKGALLAILTHQDYIKLQREYIETKKHVDYYIEDFKRQGELTLEHAASIKRMQRAQTDYWASEARLRALKAQLDYIGIDAEKVEKEGFTNTINIYAPVSGYITAVDGNIGKFIDSYAFIYEIADIDELFISFELPGMLYDKIYKDMPVKFSLSGQDDALSGATIKNIGQTFDISTNTVTIIAQPDSVNKMFRPGMNAEVVVTY